MDKCHVLASDLRPDTAGRPHPNPKTAGHAIAFHKGRAKNMNGRIDSTLRASRIPGSPA